jgi:hypothetical protein
MRQHGMRPMQRLRETVDHLHADIERVDQPRLKAMFETSAEVLEELVRAFRAYERKEEPAWRG